MFYPTFLNYSTGQPSAPNIGANVGTVGGHPYSTYVLLATVPADEGRMNGYLQIENDSGSAIALLLDDGATASGSSPTHYTWVPLAAGASVGAQGGSWAQKFTGRVSIYGPSAGLQVAAFVGY